MSSVATALVVLDPETHRYSAGMVSYVSVSEVIRSVLPTDYSAVDPAVLANARDRGIWIDDTFCAWLAGKQPVVKTGTPVDWRDRLLMLMNWWCRQTWGCTPSTQVMLQDDVNLIAGTCDFDFVTHVLDLKVVSELQPSYALQLGAYAEMADAENVGIIHVTKDRVRLVEYDAAQCREDWRAAVDWWKRKNRLTAKGKR